MDALRSLLAGRRRGLLGALFIAALLLGVVTMHAMSGSASAHGGPAAAIAVGQDTHAAPTQAPGTQNVGMGDEHGGCLDCADHGMAGAMCLMILVSLLALVRPGGHLLARLSPAWSRLVESGRVLPAIGAAPSLHVLGISRI